MNPAPPVSKMRFEFPVTLQSSKPETQVVSVSGKLSIGF
jgi:hypothetical protein